MSPSTHGALTHKVPRWSQIDLVIHAPVQLGNPVQDATLSAQLFAPSGRALSLDGFWNGAQEWRVRFSPDEEGEWRYSLRLTRSSGKDLADKNGIFHCTEATGATLFDQHKGVP